MDNPGDLHSKEPTCEMPLILLLCCKDNNNFQIKQQLWKKKYKMRKLERSSMPQ